MEIKKNEGKRVPVQAGSDSNERLGRLAARWMKGFLFAWVGWWVGVATAAVGKPPEPGVFTWALPFQVLFVVGAPALLGYLTGRFDRAA